MRRRTLSAIATGLVLTALTWGNLQGVLYYKPLPAIDGYFRFVGLDEHAEVVRDSFGIPRIEAGTLHDLFFLQGYITAQDRFAQMEAMRVRASLTFGNMPAPVDPATIAALDAYADGVTKYIEQHGEARAFPAEISLSGREPRIWTAADSLGIGELFLAGTGTSGPSCVVFPGERTFSRRPLLTADLRVDAPAPGWYELGLQGPGQRVVGLSLPGVPGVVAGHNGRVAWSLPGSPAPFGVTQAIAFMLSAGDAPRVEVLVTGATGPFCVADVHGGTHGPPLGGPPVASIDVEAMRLTFERIPAPDAAARIVIDLGDLDASKAALSTGQSGHSASFHYRDQAQMWTTGQLHRLAWTPGAIARTEGRLVLRPR